MEVPRSSGTGGKTYIPTRISPDTNLVTRTPLIVPAPNALRPDLGRKYVGVTTNVGSVEYSIAVKVTRLGSVAAISGVQTSSNQWHFDWYLALIK